MNFIKIKFFPNKIEEYVYFFLSNTIFLIILTSLIQQSVEEKNKDEDINAVMLFVPKIVEDFEEKRDLIFNQLSANNSIISLNRLEEKEIKKLLSDFFKNIELSDEIIPEVYNVEVELSKPLNFALINNKIKKIIRGALIKEFKYNKSNISLLFFISLTVIIFIILLNNFFLIKSYLFKIKTYINLSRYFGVKDSIIIRNLNMSFFVLLNLVFLLSYPLIEILSKSYFKSSMINNLSEIYIVIYFIYNFIFLSILSVLCKSYLKKLNVL